jgi:hypothetical protein
VVKAVCLRKRLLLMIVVLPPSSRRAPSSIAILGFPLRVGLGGVALPRSAYHDVIHGSLALAHAFSIHDGATLATKKSSRADGDAVPPGLLSSARRCVCDGPLATTKFREFLFHALR